MTFEEILMQCLPTVMNEVSKQYYKSLEGGGRYVTNPINKPDVVAEKAAELAKALLLEIEAYHEANNQSTPQP